MALPAFTVTCGYVGSSEARSKSQAILGKVAWQEAPATGILSTNVAPLPTEAQGCPVFRTYAAADSWFSYGKPANSAGAVRVLVRAADGLQDFYPASGDTFMWQAA
jgi:hypothetical protein